MKRYIIAILLAITLSACQSASHNHPPTDQPQSIAPTSSRSFVPEPSLVLSKPDSAVSEFEPTSMNESLTEENLIGIWHIVPYWPSGYADCHQFYADGQYLFVYNQMATLNQIKRSSNYLLGTWRLEENSIIVSIFAQDLVEGGRMECSPELYYVVGGTWKTETFSPIELVYKIDDLEYRIPMEHPEWEFPEPMLSMHLGDELFWKMDNEPDLTLLEIFDD